VAENYRRPVVRARRPFLPALALGAVSGLAAAAVVLVAIALPLFFFARAVDPARGTGRPFIHTGLVRVAVPAGLVTGLVVGPCVGVWYRRQGR
jgi:hypothetical protein